GVETDEMQKVELPILLEGEPDLVTIFAGGNDIVNGVSDIDFQNDLSEILSKIKNETSAYIVIATIPDLTKLPRFISEPDPDVTLDRIALFNQIIRALATDNGAVVVELSEVSLSDVLVSQDGFHPSDEGHATIAEKFLEVIKPMFC
ncbi:MAG: hypothetical protein KDD56_03525, partial [Bdellovibrionales bacterium]|nr:hypothetical protein [Bdellovibrionales bacterium]